VPGMRDAIADAPCGVVAVSPLVAGASVKGPTERFLEWAGVPPTADGIAQCYAGFIDGLVADEWAARVPTLETDVLMDGAEGRARLAREALEFALALAGPS
jgi:LPPG:FO 2-phospho-L-lactate transferase